MLTMPTVPLRLQFCLLEEIMQPEKKWKDKKEMLDDFAKNIHPNNVLKIKNTNRIFFIPKIVGFKAAKIEQYTSRNGGNDQSGHHQCISNSDRIFHLLTSNLYPIPQIVWI